jgi:hypothetical protein
MKIRIVNDKKEKRMSFEAILEEASASGAMFFGSVDAIGYGATENEAKLNLLLCVEKISQILKVPNE